MLNGPLTASWSKFLTLLSLADDSDRPFLARVAMLRLLNKLRRDKRGNVLIITAAAAPLLIGSAGLATDTIQWALWKRQLQRAADSAAIAGVYERNATAMGATTNVRAAVERDLAKNQHAGVLRSAALISFPADARIPDRRINQVQVTLELQKSLPFSSFFMETPPVIRASATASGVPGAGEYCVIALETRDVTGVEIGGSTNVDLGECCLISNSSHANEAFKHTGNGSEVTAGCIAAVGGVESSASERWNIGGYFPYSEAAADPYANLPTPTEDDCDKTITITKDDLPMDRSTAATDDAGQIVCINGGFEIQGDLTLGAATYVVNTKGDDLRMTSTGSSLNCTGCTIVLTNFSDRTETGNFRLNGGTVNITAPTDPANPFQGVAMYQDRLAEDDGKKGANHINGNNTVGIQGVMYMPGRSLLYNGGGGLAQQRCMQLIARRVEFTGNSGFKMGSTCAAEGLRGHSGGGWLVRLVA